MMAISMSPYLNLDGTAKENLRRIGRRRTSRPTPSEDGLEPHVRKSQGQVRRYFPSECPWVSSGNLAQTSSPQKIEASYSALDYVRGFSCDNYSGSYSKTERDGIMANNIIPSTIEYKS